VDQQLFNKHALNCARHRKALSVQIAAQLGQRSAISQINFHDGSLQQIELPAPPFTPTSVQQAPNYLAVDSPALHGLTSLICK